MLVYENYVREAAAEIPTSYRAAQDRAQAERAGLWQDPDPVSSWEWRKSKKERSRRAQDEFGLTKPPVWLAPFKGHL
jgi:endonuclease YncB( thermonuclease family)